MIFISVISGWWFQYVSIPLKKIMEWTSVGMMKFIPNWMESHKTCSKPPTRFILIHIDSILFPFINEGQLLTTGSNWDPPKTWSHSRNAGQLRAKFWHRSSVGHSFKCPEKAYGYIHPDMRWYEQMLLPSVHICVLFLFDHLFSGHPAKGLH